MRQVSVNTVHVGCDICEALRKTNQGSTLMVVGILMGLTKDVLNFCETHTGAFQRGSIPLTKSSPATSEESKR